MNPETRNLAASRLETMALMVDTSPHDSKSKCLACHNQRHDFYAGLCSTCLRSIAEELRLNEWRTIETAPKDNWARLVWCPSNQCTYTVAWDENENCWMIFGGPSRLRYSPSHWRPLPLPPTQPDGGAK